jgi:hypothetical protein
MSAFSDEMAAVATELITEFGETCTFTRNVKGSYDPTTSKAIDTSVTTFSGVCFQEEYKINEIDTANVKRGDTKVLVSPITTGETPSVGDEITFSSLSYRVINVDKTITNAETVLYTLQCRE